jgi:hypothetical protein
MLNLLRKFLRPTLREQLEDGVREALRRYTERRSAPNLRVYVSTDLVPDGTDHVRWARDEGEHLRRFALQWAEDNQVPRTGLRTEVILLDTKREFAFVKPMGVEQSGADELSPKRPPPQPTPPRPIVDAKREGVALLEVVASPSVTEPVRIEAELVVGRRSDGGVVGLGDRYMSGRHARFHISGGTLHVTDLDSKNRTYLNGKPLPPHEPIPTSVGDEVRMGTTTLRVSSVKA